MTSRFVQVSKPDGPFEIVEREIPEPSPTQARIKVQASGICHSDSLTKEGLFPGIQYPRVPGHEVAGIIDVVGSNVTKMETRAEGRCGLARWTMWSLRIL
jgi:D-arabinose 1-dehydrogenase-like Zn-dependent alcohol dehydrogenase